MTELLTKIFLKNHTDPALPKTREAYGTFSSIVGIITNFILAAVKFIAGLLSGSVAIMADAFNNLSDAGSSLITLISFKISSKPADRDHPFGHARMEYICSMVVSFLILLVGFELFTSSLTILFNPSSASPIELTPVTVVILVVSIVLKLWLGLFYKGVGKKINSGVLSATATDCFSDTVSTLAVLVCAVIIHFTSWYIIDAAVGIIVSALIIVAGAKILNETKNALLGEAPVEEVVESIRIIAAKYPEIIGIHDMIVHNYGPKNFIASFHAEVDGDGDIYLLHDTIDNVEKDIKETLGIACTVHLDPIDTRDEVCSELRSFLFSVMEKNKLNYSVHDFRVVTGATHTNMIFDIIVPFEEKTSPAVIIEKIQKAVIEQRANHYCVITVDRG
ncbi:MAG: cation transporter [Clostridia bacterium]|nr:cation transporter [Clostridia bacterium]